jgi:hypothetical protein
MGSCCFSQCEKAACGTEGSNANVASSARHWISLSKVLRHALKAEWLIEGQVGFIHRPTFFPFGALFLSP